MNPAFSAPQQTESDFAAIFWPPAPSLKFAEATHRRAKRSAANLFELFQDDLSQLVVGACQADRLARACSDTLAPDQIRLRRLVLGLAQSARGCLPALPPVLREAGLVLPASRDVVVEALLRPINPHRRRPGAIEPKSVTGFRTVGALTQVALHFEAAAAHSADDARVLGSDRLFEVLAKWAAVWRGYLHELRRRAMSFRARAYGAGLSLRFSRQSA